MTRAFSALTVAALAAAASVCMSHAAAGAPVSQTCQRDALVMLSEVREARAELAEAATASDRERCAAWRNQAATLRKASAFYKRCQSGAERDRNVANANAGVAQYDGAVRTQCGGK